MTLFLLGQKKWKRREELVVSVKRCSLMSKGGSEVRLLILLSVAVLVWVLIKIVKKRSINQDFEAQNSSTIRENCLYGYIDM
jgi:hypothetical protein